jgi:hypothetical protein
MGFGGRRLRAPLRVFGRGAISAMLLSLALGQPALAQSTARPAARPASPPPAVQPPAPPEPPANSVGGMGDVNLYPKRVIIDQRQRVATVGLFNRASATGNYEIKLSDMMMTPDGRLVDLASVSDPAVRDRVKTASKLIRWSPHRVTLASHDSQTVRLMARVPPDLPPGEYRSHFSAVALPDVGTGGLSIEDAAGTAKPGAIGVTIVPRFGISIPVIVRVGETTVTAGLRDLTVTQQPDGNRVISLTVTREGNRSAYGDFVITAAGSKTKVSEIRGIGVYTEVSQRALQMLVDPAADPRLTARGARLTVTYTDDDFAPGKILARQDFIVP